MLSLSRGLVLSNPLISSVAVSEIKSGINKFPSEIFFDLYQVKNLELQ